jgi:choline-glycine betaine transporter
MEGLQILQGKYVFEGLSWGWVVALSAIALILLIGISAMMNTVGIAISCIIIVVGMMTGFGKTLGNKSYIEYTVKPIRDDYNIDFEKYNIKGVNGDYIILTTTKTNYSKEDALNEINQLQMQQMLDINKELK